MTKGKIKLYSVMLVLLLLITITAGCGKSEDVQGNPDQTEDNISEDVQGDGDEPVPEEEPEPTYDFGGRSIRWAAWWDLAPVAGSSESADKLVARLSEMEEKYNFKAEYVNVPWEQFVEKFSASTLAGEPFAELAEVEYGWFFPGLVANGFVYPVSDLGVFDLEQDKWTDETVGMGTFNGKVYGFATGKIYPRGMFWWNKSMFEREGLPNLYELRDNKTWTWDKMLEIAQKATKDLDGDGTIDQWGLGGIDVSEAMVVSNGGSLMEMRDGKPVFTLNEPAAIEALQYYQDLLHLHTVFDIPPEGAQWDYATQQFQNGKTAMYAYQIWMSGQFSENMVDDYGLTVFPMGPRMDEYTSLMTINNLTVIPSAVERPEEIAIYYDERTEPFPDEDPEVWKEGYESWVRDNETFESLEMVMEDNISKVWPIRNFPEVEKMSWSYNWAINTANKTPQVAIDEIAQQAQALLEDAFSLE